MASILNIDELQKSTALSDIERKTGIPEEETYRTIMNIYSKTIASEIVPIRPSKIL